MFLKVVCLSFGDPKCKKKTINHAICKKWPKKDFDPKDNAYEMPILVYNGNQNVLVSNERGNSKVE
jgi:hypothetical protein